jgi:hypothetical protein
MLAVLLPDRTLARAFPMVAIAGVSDNDVAKPARRIALFAIVCDQFY